MRTIDIIFLIRVSEYYTFIHQWFNDDTNYGIGLNEVKTIDILYVIRTSGSFKQINSC